MIFIQKKEKKKQNANRPLNTFTKMNGISYAVLAIMWALVTSEFFEVPERKMMVVLCGEVQPSPFLANCKLQSHH